MERGEWIITDISYALEILKEIDAIALDVYEIVVEFTKDLVGENKREDSEQVLAKIKAFCISNWEKEIDYSMFDQTQKSELQNHFFPIKSDIAIIKSIFN